MASVEQSDDVYTSEITIGDVVATLFGFSLQITRDLFKAMDPAIRPIASATIVAIAVLLIVWMWIHPAIEKRQPAKIE